MIVLLGHTSGPKAEQALAGRNQIGLLMSPSHFGRPWLPCYACDNDAYSHRHDPGWWKREGEAAWRKMLDKVAALEEPPMFCLLPDVVADWNRTLDRAHRYHEELTCRNLPVAVALQDGCDYAEALALSPVYVFIGGSTRWKWEHAEEITDWFHWRDVHVHVGRVSGWRRVRECRRLIVDSCDGTGWFRNPGRELPLLFRELDGYDTPQGVLAL